MFVPKIIKIKILAGVRCRASFSEIRRCLYINSFKGKIISNNRFLPFYYNTVKFFFFVSYYCMPALYFVNVVCVCKIIYMFSGAVVTAVLLEFFYCRAYVCVFGFCLISSP